MYWFVRPERLNPQSFPRLTHDAGLGQVCWLAEVVEESPPCQAGGALATG